MQNIEWAQIAIGAITGGLFSGFGTHLVKDFKDRRRINWSFDRRTFDHGGINGLELKFNKNELEVLDVYKLRIWNPGSITVEDIPVSVTIDQGEFLDYSNFKNSPGLTYKLEPHSASNPHTVRFTLLKLNTKEFFEVDVYVKDSKVVTEAIRPSNTEAKKLGVNTDTFDVERMISRIIKLFSLLMILVLSLVILGIFSFSYALNRMLVIERTNQAASKKWFLDLKEKVRDHTVNEHDIEPLEKLYEEKH